MRQILYVSLVSSLLSFSAGAATFVATEDATVKKGNPSTNYGSSSSLETDSRPMKEIFLKFQVSGLVSPVMRAKVRVYVTNASSSGAAIFSTDPGWSEKDVTWASRPSRIGGSLGASVKPVKGTWLEFVVTSAVSANGVYELRHRAERE